MKYFTIFIFLLLADTSLGQCDGNLGENIFTDGDFGSGADNILLSNPQIAPGYNYSYAPPPNDGDYTITNNTTNWGSFAVNWENISDNSGNPNGYMMVVNASFEPGLFYEQEVTGLCDDTEFEFSTDIYNLIIGTNNVILPNVSFLLDGAVVFSTGDVPGNGQWNTYAFTFATAPGQTSVTLALQNNAPGGAGNDLALDNISFRACGPSAEILPESIANICEDGDPITIEATITGDQYDNPSIQWQQSTDQGSTWTSLPGQTSLTYTHTDLAAGYYYYRYLLANGDTNLANSKCRVHSNTKIIYVQPKRYTVIDTICEGLALTIMGQAVVSSGVYTDSLLSTIGCDSIVTTELTVVDDPPIVANVVATDPSCHYANDGSITIDDIDNAYLPVGVIINGSTVGTNLEGLADGSYDLIITDRHGCSLQQRVELTDPPAFTIELGAAATVSLGQELTLTPVVSEAAYAYELSGSSMITCDDDCSAITWLPTKNGTVFLSALSADNDCFAADSIDITVIKDRKIFFPNVFSPNGDNMNDSFTIKGSQPNVQSVRSLHIYDRWGGEIYTIENTTLDNTQLQWDGTASDGSPLLSGVYTYKIAVSFLDGVTLPYYGTVTLLR